MLAFLSTSLPMMDAAETFLCRNQILSLIVLGFLDQTLLRDFRAIGRPNAFLGLQRLQA